MPIEVGKRDEPTTFVGPAATNFYRMVVLLSSMKSELKTGMRLSSKLRSPFSIVKQEYNLKGNKQKIIDQFEALVITENKKMEYVNK